MKSERISPFWVNGYQPFSAAVAFELRKNSAEGELVYFFNMFSYDIPAGVDLTNTKLYAVQADGKRIEIRKK